MPDKIGVYISGNANNKAQFDEAVAAVRAAGFEALNSNAPTLHDTVSHFLSLSLILKADVVYFAPGWSRSVCSQFELSYCKYIKKPCAMEISEISEVLEYE